MGVGVKHTVVLKKHNSEVISLLLTVHCKIFFLCLPSMKVKSFKGFEAMALKFILEKTLYFALMLNEYEPFAVELRMKLQHKFSR